MTTNDTRTINTIGLSGKERRAMIEAMDLSQKRQVKKEVRRGLRVSFNVGTIVVAVTHPNGNTVRYSVVPRNISTRGLAFLHGRFIYSSSPVQVFLPALDKQWMRINGAVLNCRHVNGLIHEVSVVFDKPTDIRPFVELSREQVALARKELGGRALVVEEAKLERENLSKHLTDAGMSVVHVAEEHTATAELSRQSFGVVVVDLSEESGVAFVKKLREGDFGGIIVGIGKGDSAEASARAGEAGCNSYLPKPVQSEMLHQVIDQLLQAEHDTGAGEKIHSTLANDEHLKTLIPTFLQELGRSISRIHAAFRAEEYENINKWVAQIKGGANDYGFPALAEQAKIVMESLVARPMDKQVLGESIEKLAAISGKIDNSQPMKK